MNQDIKKVIELLPSNWNELKLYQFKKMLDLEVSEYGDFEGLFDGIDNTLKVLSVLSGIETEVLESMNIKDVQVMANKIAFISTEPNVKGYKSSIKWKKIDEVTYSDYVTFITLSNEPLKNIELIIQSFSLNKLTDEEINNLSMLEVHAGFFTLTKQLKRFLLNTTRRTATKLAKQMIVQMYHQLFRTKLKAK